MSGWVCELDLFGSQLKPLAGALEHDNNKKIPWPGSANELYQPSDRRLSVKLVPTFADRGYHVVSVTDPYGRILGLHDNNVRDNATEAGDDSFSSKSPLCGVTPFLFP
jgi:CBS-domain-containing membrane protein